MKKTVVTIVLAALVMMSLTNCGDKGGIAMKYKDSEVGEREYYYWLTQYRAFFLEEYNNSEDSPEFWDGEVSEGVNTESFLQGIVIDNVKRNLICMQLFEEYGLELSDEAIASVESDLKDLEDSYDSRSEMNLDLSRSGINYDILKEIYMIQEKVSAVEEYLYGDSGAMTVTDEDIDEYYQDNYARIKYISLTANDENEALTKEILDELNNGGDFEALYIRYNEESLEGYENGVYISREDMGYDIISEAFTMEIGNVKRVDQDSAIFIVKRYELEDKPYLTDTMEQFTDLADNCEYMAFQAVVNEKLPDVVLNNNVIDKYSLKSLS